MPATIPTGPPPVGMNVKGIIKLKPEQYSKFTSAELPAVCELEPTNFSFFLDSQSEAVAKLWAYGTGCTLQICTQDGRVLTLDEAPITIIQAAGYHCPRARVKTFTELIKFSGTPEHTYCLLKPNSYDLLLGDKWVKTISWPTDVVLS